MRRAAKGGRVVPIRAGGAVEMRGSIVGHITTSTNGGFFVDFPGNPHGPTLARSVVPLAELARAHRASAQPDVLILFEASRSDRPIIVGVIASPPMTEAALLEENELREALVDGRRVVLEAKEEVVLKCGKALIVMRRNGRVVIRGTHIETDSQGVNRIKGGSVQLD